MRKKVGVVSDILVYPIKGCRGISLEASEFDPKGLLWDRTFMLVNHVGMFLSQRNFPRMALIETSFEEDQLVVTAPGMSPFSFRLVTEERDGPPLVVRVHKDLCRGVDIGDEAAEWFSRFLGKQCRLVGQVYQHPRLRTLLGLNQVGSLSYADGYPVLVTSTSSLADLNNRMTAVGGQAVPMDRFRPNIVISGCSAYEEDTWNCIWIGPEKIELVAGTKCARCPVTSVDQKTGEFSEDPRPILKGYHVDEEGKEIFGRNFSVTYVGMSGIVIDDPVWLIR